MNSQVKRHTEAGASVPVDRASFTVPVCTSANLELIEPLLIGFYGGFLVKA